MYNNDLLLVEDIFHDTINHGREVAKELGKEKEEFRISKRNVINLSCVLLRILSLKVLTRRVLYYLHLRKIELLAWHTIQIHTDKKEMSIETSLIGHLHSDIVHTSWKFTF